MKILLSLLLFVTSARAATLAQALLYTTDTTGTNARPSAVTLSPSTGGTNLMAGVLTATNSASVGSTGGGNDGINLQTNSITITAGSGANPFFRAYETVGGGYSYLYPGYLNLHPGGVYSGSFSPGNSTSGASPFWLKSTADWTGFNIAAISNQTALAFSVRGDSGYAGAGTKALTDDGTYKTFASSGAPSGTVVNSGTPADTALPRYTGTTGTNITPTSITVSGGTNLLAGVLTATNSVSVGAAGTAGSITLGDTDGSNFLTFNPDPATTTNVNVIWPAYPFTGLLAATLSSGTNFTLSKAAITDYKEFVAPFRVDSAGCTIVTNSYTSDTWGLATYSGTADTNGNYALFRLGKVPYNLNTNVTMTLKGLAIRIGGTSTTSPSFSIAYYQPADSSPSMPTDFTGCSGFIVSTAVTISSATAGDIFYFSDITLTSWVTSLTSGRDFILAIARGDNGNNDSIAITAGSIEFSRYP